LQALRSVQALCFQASYAENTEEKEVF
jgi:hypothetical protein